MPSQSWSHAALTAVDGSIGVVAVIVACRMLLSPLLSAVSVPSQSSSHAALTTADGSIIGAVAVIVACCSHRCPGALVLHESCTSECCPGALSPTSFARVGVVRVLLSSTSLARVSATHRHKWVLPECCCPPRVLHRGKRTRAVPTRARLVEDKSTHGQHSLAQDSCGGQQHPDSTHSCKTRVGQEHSHNTHSCKTRGGREQPGSTHSCKARGGKSTRAALTCARLVEDKGTRAAMRAACDNDCDGTEILPSAVVRAAVCDDDCDGTDNTTAISSGESSMQR
jgi:hypothetical protein